MSDEIKKKGYFTVEELINFRLGADVGNRALIKITDTVYESVEPLWGDDKYHVSFKSIEAKLLELKHLKKKQKDAFLVYEAEPDTTNIVPSTVNALLDYTYLPHVGKKAELYEKAQEARNRYEGHFRVEHYNQARRFLLPVQGLTPEYTAVMNSREAAVARHGAGAEKLASEVISHVNTSTLTSKTTKIGRPIRLYEAFHTNSFIGEESVYGRDLIDEFERSTDMSSIFGEDRQENIKYLTARKEAAEFIRDHLFSNTYVDIVTPGMHVFKTMDKTKREHLASATEHAAAKAAFDYMSSSDSVREIKGLFSAGKGHVALKRIRESKYVAGAAIYAKEFLRGSGSLFSYDDHAIIISAVERYYNIQSDLYENALSLSAVVKAQVDSGDRREILDLRAVVDNSYKQGALINAIRDTPPNEFDSTPYERLSAALLLKINDPKTPESSLGKYIRMKWATDTLNDIMLISDDIGFMTYTSEAAEAKYMKDNDGKKKPKVGFGNFAGEQYDGFSYNTALDPKEIVELPPTVLSDLAGQMRTFLAKNADSYNDNWQAVDSDYWGGFLHSAEMGKLMSLHSNQITRLHKFVKWQERRNKALENSRDILIRAGYKYDHSTLKFMDEKTALYMLEGDRLANQHGSGRVRFFEREVFQSMIAGRHDSASYAIKIMAKNPWIIYEDIGVIYPTASSQAKYGDNFYSDREYGYIDRIDVVTAAFISKNVELVSEAEAKKKRYLWIDELRNQGSNYFSGEHAIVQSFAIKFLAQQSERSRAASKAYDTIRKPYNQASLLYNFNDPLSLSLLEDQFIVPDKQAIKWAKDPMTKFYQRLREGMDRLHEFPPHEQAKIRALDEARKVVESTYIADPIVYMRGREKDLRIVTNEELNTEIDLIAGSIKDVKLRDQRIWDLQERQKKAIEARLESNPHIEEMSTKFGFDYDKHESIVMTAMIEFVFNNKAFVDATTAPEWMSQFLDEMNTNTLRRNAIMSENPSALVNSGGASSILETKGILGSTGTEILKYQIDLQKRAYGNKRFLAMKERMIAKYAHRRYIPQEDIQKMFFGKIPAYGLAHFDKAMYGSLILPLHTADDLYNTTRRFGDLEYLMDSWLNVSGPVSHNSREALFIQNTKEIFNYVDGFIVNVPMWHEKLLNKDAYRDEYVSAQEREFRAEHGILRRPDEVIVDTTNKSKFRIGTKVVEYELTDRQKELEGSLRERMVEAEKANASMADRKHKKLMARFNKFRETQDLVFSIEDRIALYLISSGGVRGRSELEVLAGMLDSGIITTDPDMSKFADMPIAVDVISALKEGSSFGVGVGDAKTSIRKKTSSAIRFLRNEQNTRIAARKLRSSSYGFFLNSQNWSDSDLARLPHNETYRPDGKTEKTIDATTLLRDVGEGYLHEPKDIINTRKAAIERRQLHAKLHWRERQHEESILAALNAVDNLWVLPDSATTEGAKHYQALLVQEFEAGLLGSTLSKAKRALLGKTTSELIDKEERAALKQAELEDRRAEDLKLMYKKIGPLLRKMDLVAVEALTELAETSIYDLKFSRKSELVAHVLDHVNKGGGRTQLTGSLRVRAINIMEDQVRLHRNLENFTNRSKSKLISGTDPAVFADFTKGMIGYTTQLDRDFGDKFLHSNYKETMDSIATEAAYTIEMERNDHSTLFGNLVREVQEAYDIKAAPENAMLIFHRIFTSGRYYHLPSDQKLKVLYGGNAFKKFLEGKVAAQLKAGKVSPKLASEEISDVGATGFGGKGYDHVSGGERGEDAFIQAGRMSHELGFSVEGGPLQGGMSDEFGNSIGRSSIGLKNLNPSTTIGTFGDSAPTFALARTQNRPSHRSSKLTAVSPQARFAGLASRTGRLHSSGYSSSVNRLLSNISDLPDGFANYASNMFGRMMADKKAMIAGSLLKGRSMSTYLHAVNTTMYVMRAAQWLNVPYDQAYKMSLAAFVHDVGKTFTPGFVLESPYKLTNDQFYIMKQHTEYTVAALRKLGFPEDIIALAASHHQFVTGGQYPANISSRELALASQLMMGADIISAFMEPRVYSDAAELSRTFSILGAESNAGKLDPVIIAIYAEALVNKSRSSAFINANNVIDRDMWLHYEGYVNGRLRRSQINRIFNTENTITTADSLIPDLSDVRSMPSAVRPIIQDLMDRTVADINNTAPELNTFFRSMLTDASDVINATFFDRSPLFPNAVEGRDFAGRPSVDIIRGLSKSPEFKDNWVLNRLGKIGESRVGLLASVAAVGAAAIGIPLAMNAGIGSIVQDAYAMATSMDGSMFGDLMGQIGDFAQWGTAIMFGTNKLNFGPHSADSGHSHPTNIYGVTPVAPKKRKVYTPDQLSFTTLHHPTPATFTKTLLSEEARAWRRDYRRRKEELKAKNETTYNEMVEYKAHKLEHERIEIRTGYAPFVEVGAVSIERYGWNWATEIDKRNVVKLGQITLIASDRVKKINSMQKGVPLINNVPVTEVHTLHPNRPTMEVYTPIKALPVQDTKNSLKGRLASDAKKMELASRQSMLRAAAEKNKTKSSKRVFKVSPDALAKASAGLAKIGGSQDPVEDISKLGNNSVDSKGNVVKVLSWAGAALVGGASLLSPEAAHAATGLVDTVTNIGPLAFFGGLAATGVGGSLMLSHLFNKRQRRLDTMAQYQQVMAENYEAVRHTGTSEEIAQALVDMSFADLVSYEDAKAYLDGPYANKKFKTAVSKYMSSISGKLGIAAIAGGMSSIVPDVAHATDLYDIATSFASSPWAGPAAFMAGTAATVVGFSAGLEYFSNRSRRLAKEEEKFWNEADVKFKEAVTEYMSSVSDKVKNNRYLGIAALAGGMGLMTPDLSHAATSLVDSASMLNPSDLLSGMSMSAMLGASIGSLVSNDASQALMDRVELIDVADHNEHGERGLYKVIGEWPNDHESAVQFSYKNDKMMLYTLWRNKSMMPERSGGKMVAATLKKAGLAVKRDFMRPKEVVGVDIIHEPTIEAVSAGVHPSRTTIGHTLSNVVSELGGKVIGWDYGLHVGIIDGFAPSNGVIDWMEPIIDYNNRYSAFPKIEVEDKRFNGVWTHVKDSNALVSFIPSGPVVNVQTVFRGNQPPRSAGKMLADTLRATGNSKPAVIIFDHITHERTNEQLAAGTPLEKTTLGHMLTNTVGELGGKILSLNKAMDGNVLEAMSAAVKYGKKAIGLGITATGLGALSAVDAHAGTSFTDAAINAISSSTLGMGLGYSAAAAAGIGLGYAIDKGMNFVGSKFTGISSPNVSNRATALTVNDISSIQSGDVVNLSSDGSYSVSAPSPATINGYESASTAGWSPKVSTTAQESFTAETSLNSPGFGMTGVAAMALGQFGAYAASVTNGYTAPTTPVVGDIMGVVNSGLRVMQNARLSHPVLTPVMGLAEAATVFATDGIEMVDMTVSALRTVNDLGLGYSMSVWGDRMSDIYSGLKRHGVSQIGGWISDVVAPTMAREFFSLVGDIGFDALFARGIISGTKSLLAGTASTATVGQAVLGGAAILGLIQAPNIAESYVNYANAGVSRLLGTDTLPSLPINRDRRYDSINPPSYGPLSNFARGVRSFFNEDVYSKNVVMNLSSTPDPKAVFTNSINPFSTSTIGMTPEGKRMLAELSRLEEQDRVRNLMAAEQRFVNYDKAMVAHDKAYRNWLQNAETAFKNYDRRQTDYLAKKERVDAYNAYVNAANSYNASPSAVWQRIESASMAGYYNYLDRDNMRLSNVFSSVYQTDGWTTSMDILGGIAEVRDMKDTTIDNFLSSEMDSVGFSFVSDETYNFIDSDPWSFSNKDLSYAVAGGFLDSMEYSGGSPIDGMSKAQYDKLGLGNKFGLGFATTFLGYDTETEAWNAGWGRPTKDVSGGIYSALGYGSNSLIDKAVRGSGSIDPSTGAFNVNNFNEAMRDPHLAAHLRSLGNEISPKQRGFSAPGQSINGMPSGYDPDGKDGASNAPDPGKDGDSVRDPSEADGWAKYGDIISGRTSRLIGEGGQPEAIVPLKDGVSIDIVDINGTLYVEMPDGKRIEAKLDAQAQALYMRRGFKAIVNGVFNKTIIDQMKPGGIFNR